MKHKSSKKVLSLLVALTLPLSSNIINLKKDVPASSTKNLLEINIDDEDMNNILIDYYTNIFDNVYISHNCSQYYEYYDYNELLDLIEENKSTNACDYIYDGNIDNLIENIKSNTQEFIESNSEYINAFNDNSSEYSEEQQVFEIILKKCLQNIIVNSTNDIDEDICHIKDLKIVFGNTSSDSEVAYYKYSKNLIVIDIEKVKTTRQNISTRTFSDSLELVLSHELEHVRQTNCDDIEENNINYFSFFVEPAAESQLYNQNNDLCYTPNSTYEYYYSITRKQESVLFLLALFNENTSLDDYYNSIRDNNLKEFYEFFNLETKDDLRTFYEIIDNIKALTEGSNISQNILSNYNNQNINLDDISGHAYKIDILKKVLTNMVEYTVEHDEFTLEENVALLNIIKNIIVTNQHNDSIITNDSNFNQSLNECLVIYNTFLCSNYNISQSSLLSTELEYRNISNKLNNILEKKFPILKSINYTDTYNNDAWNNYLTNNNIDNSIYYDINSYTTNSQIKLLYEINTPLFKRINNYTKVLTKTK